MTSTRDEGSRPPVRVSQDQHDQDGRMGGARLVDHAPFGHWSTQTFFALRHDRLDAPWLIAGRHVNMPCRAVDEPGILRPSCRNPTGPDPARGRRRDLGYPRYPPKPEGRRNPAGQWRRVHFSGKTAHWTPFRSLKLLPPCSPDLNQVEMAFAKPKTLIRKAAARPYDQVWQAVGSVGNLLKEEVCCNFFKAAGYETN